MPDRDSYWTQPKPDYRDCCYRKPGEPEPEAGEPMFGTAAISDPDVDYYGDEEDD